MQISVFGTGEVGTAIATVLKSLGHDVVLGSRHTGRGDTPLMVRDHASAAEHGTLLVNAMHGEDALDVFPTLPMDGKVLWDVGNFRTAIDSPLEATLGESLQGVLPRTRLVKAMNFVSAKIMGDPARLAGNHTVFIAGNDAAAKQTVADLLGAIGWQDILDLGDVSACRAMESLAPMWIRLNQVLGTVDFDLEVVRKPAM